jgi:hypothetical protein
MIDISDVRLYGVGAILLILSMGYFVYLLYNDVVFIKKEISEIKGVTDNYTSEEIEDDNSDTELYDSDDDYSTNKVFNDDDLENHMDSFMVPDQTPKKILETIYEEDEPVGPVELVQVLEDVSLFNNIPKKKQQKPKAKPKHQVLNLADEIEIPQ